MNELNDNQFEITHECIQTQSNIGETIYHNICQGTEYIVPWGGMDWIFPIFFAIFTIFAFYVSVFKF